MQNIVTLGEINDALKIAAVTAAQLADMGFAALANKPICEGLPPEESRRLRNAKLYPAESIGHIRATLAQRFSAPALEQAPESGQSRFHGQPWTPCSAEHVTMVLAAPHEWKGYEVRYLYAAPVQAVPAEVTALLEALESMVDVCEGHDFDGAPSDAHMGKARSAISAYRAALAATPAAMERTCGVCGADEAFTGTCGGGRANPTALCFEGAVATSIPAAAAPVVLPEPAYKLRVNGVFQDPIPAAHAFGLPDGEHSLFTEQQLRALLATATGLPAQAVEPHPDDVAVDALAALMKAKLAKQRDKGYGGWDTDCTRERLSDLMRDHVDKGDPVDVANFCAFLSARGEGIAPAPDVTPAFPAMTDELASILGLMCFQCISFAQALRAGGYSIKKRAEDEQAAVLHWMLGHYFSAGADGWRAAASADMERLRESTAKEGDTA